MDGFIGEVKYFTGTFAPMNWLFCEGQQLPIVQYTPLYSLIGTQFGGDGKNYFKLTLKMMVEFSSVKTSEKTLQRHSLSLREKKVLDCVNKIDGNYLKISDEALEFLGGAR